MDTNVLFSSLKSRRGASFQLLSLVNTGAFHLSLSVPLCIEYEDVAMRQTKTPPDATQLILAYLIRSAELHEIFFLWRPLLDDPKDDLVLEIAVQSQSEFIVTFNKRHFSPAKQFGIRVLTPLEFLKEIGELP
jgi:predicted nucleic acid-binding protein